MSKKVCDAGSTGLSMNKALSLLGIVALLLILTGIAQAEDLSLYRQDPASTGNTNESFSDDLELLWRYNISDTVWEVSISSDGEYIAAGCFDDTVYFFNREGKLLWQYKTGTIVKSVSISSDGEYIAAGSASHSYISDEYGEAKVYLFNRAGKLLWSYEPDGPSVDKVSISSDGNYIVAGVEGYPSKLYVFNTKGKLLWSREDIDPDDTSISSDGSYVVTSCCDQEVWGVCLFNKDGKLLWRYEVYDGPYSVSVSADGSYVTAGSDGKVYFFNRAGKLLWSYQHPEQRERYLFSIDVDAELEEDLKKGICPERLKNIFKTKGIPLDENIIPAIKNNWDIGEYSIQKEKGKIDFYRRYSGMYIFYTWISPDGNYVAAKTRGKLYFFNKEGELLWSFQTEGDPGSIWRGVSISSDGRYVVVGNYGDDHHYDGNLYFFNRNGELLGEYKTNTSVESASISSDGSYVAVGTFNMVYCFSTDVPDIGYAVLVAGDDDGFFDRKGINNNANTAYRALKSRGFDDERILYLNSRTPQDADGEGDNDVDKPSSFKDFEEAMEWARERVGVYSPFILYLVGHCDGNSFYLNDVDTISPGFRLDYWLGELPTGTRMLIVIDSCYAGSFITPPNGDISAINRIIITSSGDHSVSDTILYSGSLFSQKFWQYLGQGRNVKEAFVEGTKDANRIGMLAGKYWDPWLDDNGDAVGHSPLFMGDDGEFAANMKIGVPGATPSVGEGAPNRQLFEDCYDRNGGASNLGYPINNVHRWGKGYIQDFRGGDGYESAIMQPDGVNYAYAMYGSIWSKYLTLGGAEGAFGYPLSDESPLPTSSISGAECRYKKFYGGMIVHHATGPEAGLTVFLGHGIFNKWEDLTYGESALGLPTSDEREAHQSGTEGFDTTGVICDFEGGHIYWHRTGEYKDKAFEVHGAIDGSYQNEGGSGSWLGFPISDEYKDSSAGYARSDFEGGYITTPDGINYHAYPYELPQHDLAVTQWKIETVDSQGDVGSFTSLAIDGDGNPAISYYDSTNQDLKYAYWKGDNWIIETVDSFGNAGWPTSLAFDTRANPAIAYYDYDNCNLKYAHWNGTSWKLERVDNVGTTGSWNNYCMHISLVFNNSGNPAIAYYNGGSYWDLKFAHFGRGGWNRQTVYDDGWNGGWTRSAVLAFDSTGNPAISFREPYIGLRNAHWTGTSWNIQTVDSGYGTGACNSFLFDLQGSPTIAYFWQGVYQGDSELRYTHFSGTSWGIETVDSNVSDVSLAFDISENPSISYYDRSKEDLKYACWDSSAWIIETVDSTGNVGLHSSLAYDSQGNPAISYYDATNGDLKFATRNPPAQGQSDAVIVDKSAKWRYTFSPIGDWIDIYYDSSTWDIGEAPFANVYPGICLSGITEFPAYKTLYARYEFELKKIPTKGDLYLAYDNDITVYLNGQNVYSKQKEGCGAYWNDEISVSGFNTGKNVLVCVVKDRGDASFFDAKLIAHGISQSDVITITSPIPLVPSTLKVLMSNGSVVTMDLDEYLKGVVATEMYSSWPIEALKAQAVVSRSFAIANTHHDHIKVDVCTDPGCCQAWRAGPYSETVEKAITETHNVVITYNGKIAKEALFFAHCNGHTRNSEDYCPGGHCWDYVPYLRSVLCDCGFSAYYGSGVGMCQQGAKSMAGQGYSYVDILKHYYTGIEVASSSPAPAEQPFLSFSDNFSTDSGEWTYVETVYNVDTGEKCPGSAYRDHGNEYLVLTNSDYQAGVIWFNRDIFSPFTAEFRYKAGRGTGADGLVFMFYKQKDYEPYNGGCLGFTTPPGGSSSSTPVPGYGIEFDNFNNGFDGGEGQFDDPSENHIALIKDSVDNHIKYVDDPRTEDDQWHNVKIIVGNSTIEVYVDSELVLRWEGKIDRTYGGFGFSGATGYYDCWHIIDDVGIVLGETIDNAISAYSFQYPIDDYVVTGYKFGQEVGSGRFHLGEDVLKPPGTPVYACADGIVKLANNKHAGDGNYGVLIIVEHTLPAGEKVCSLYGHLDHNKTLVGETEIVKKGETIGVIGREDPNINGNSTPHLHFGIRYGAFSGEYASDPNTTSGWYWAGYGKVDPNIKTNWWLKPSKLIKEQTNFSSTPTPITTPPPEPTNANAQSEIAWYDQEEGMQIAKSQNKPAMIFFYSDRCPWSKKQKEVFADTRVINMSKIFVPIVGSRGLDSQYGIRYVPTIVFTNSQGMEINRIVGYRDSDTLVNEMQYALMLLTILDVPFFSQRDPAWRDKKLDHSTYSLGEYGCALTSAAMVAK